MATVAAWSRATSEAHNPIAPAPRTSTLLSGCTRASPTPRTVTASGSVIDAVTASTASGTGARLTTGASTNSARPPLRPSPRGAPPRLHRLVRPVLQNAHTPHATLG